MAMRGFGGRLRSAREMRGLTQSAVARKMDVARRTMSRWEKGETEPSLSEVDSLSRLLRVSTDYLIREVDDDPAPSKADAAA
jgi:transcriptional regulator with XRE-family HTH domain